MPTVAKKLRDDAPEIFYHALYHHVAHWAAYVATMVLLLTIGFLVSLTPIVGSPFGMRRMGAYAAAVCAFFAASYFIRGMNTYGGIINSEYLPDSYLQKVLSLPHTWMIFSGHFAALVLFLWDICLIRTL